MGRRMTDIEDIPRLPDRQQRLDALLVDCYGQEELSAFGVYFSDALQPPFAALWRDPDDPDHEEAVTVAGLARVDDRRGVRLKVQRIGRRDRYVLAEQLRAEGSFVRVIDESIAFHSHHLDDVRPILERDLASILPRPARAAFLSTVTAGRLPGTELGAEYWGRNFRETVRFAEAIRTAHADGARVFLEVGPHPVLAAPIRECLGHDATVLAAQRRDAPLRATLLRSVRNLLHRKKLMRC